jgi:hypothetical protein
VSSSLSRKALPVIIGFVALTMLVRHSGARRQRTRHELEDSDGV